MRSVFVNDSVASHPHSLACLRIEHDGVITQLVLGLESVREHCVLDAAEEAVCGGHDDSVARAQIGERSAVRLHTPRYLAAAAESCELLIRFLCRRAAHILECVAATVAICTK